MKKIKVLKKLNIVIVAVLLFSLIFALPCSAEEVNKYFNPTNRQLTATWVVQDGLDSGSQNLTYEGSISVGGLAWLSYGNVPFNIGTDGTSYTLEITVAGLVIGLDKVDTPWHVVTRYAIGNGSSIFTLYDGQMVIESSDGANVQYLNQTVKGNVAFVNDDIYVYSAGAYSIKLVFNFPRTDWSNSNHLYLFGFNFTRQITVQETITSSAGLIIDTDGDGSIIDNIYEVRDDINGRLDSEADIYAGLPDVTDYEPDFNLAMPIELVATASWLSNTFTTLLDSFGMEMQWLWWLLLFVGIFGSLVGCIVFISRRGDK